MSNSLTLTLETVTPLFLGGAEARGAPELRPPAFRGALRYWLRAALGGVLGDQDLKSLHSLETAVFGSTEQCSSISLRLRALTNELAYESEKILPHKQGKESGSRLAFKAGEKFTLTMGQMHSDEKIWYAACAALSLALTFGGVGLRSRRGYGTLRVAKSSDISLAHPFPSSLVGWQKHVEGVATETINSAQALAESRGIRVATSLLAKQASYPCATQAGSIRISSDLKAKTAIEAVTTFMKKVPKNHAFGGISPRQASPLWVRPILVGDGYGLLMVVLDSQFPGRNYDLVRKFVSSFDGEDITVKGWNV